MDELFCDVEEQCLAHLKDLEGEDTSDLTTSSPVFFNLNPDRTDPLDRHFGFFYQRDPNRPHTGYRLPEYDPHAEKYPGIAVLEAASHLASHIRDEISSKLGLTSSAGIGCNKLLAKLAADLHKPALQALMDPGRISDESSFGMGLNVQPFMDPMKVEKLNGFGWRTGKTLRNRLLGEPEPARGSYGDADKVNGTFAEGRPFFAQQDDERLDGESEGEGDEDDLARQPSVDGVYGMTLKAADANQRPHSNNLTVRAVRCSSSLELFNEWFGSSSTAPNSGPRLWSLLHGRDDSKVIPTGEFPKQIGVEDSWLETRTLEDLVQKTRTLCESLIRRLEHELIEQKVEMASGHDSIPAVADNFPMTPNVVWKRYPTQIRLSLRNGRQVARESRTTRMPVEIFDVESKEAGGGLSRERRARIMVNVLLPAIRSILRSIKPDWNINVINVVAIDLRDPLHYKFTKGISSYLDVDGGSQLTRVPNDGGTRTTFDPDTVDWEFVKALPNDIKHEILAQYGIAEPDSKKRKNDFFSRYSSTNPMTQTPTRGKGEEDTEEHQSYAVENESDDDDEMAEMDMEQRQIQPVCPRCGERVFAWMSEAHGRFHAQVSSQEV